MSAVLEPRSAGQLVITLHPCLTLGHDMLAAYAVWCSLLCPCLQPMLPGSFLCTAHITWHHPCSQPTPPVTSQWLCTTLCTRLLRTTRVAAAMAEWPRPLSMVRDRWQG